MSKSFDAAQVAAPLDEYGEGSIIFLGMESFLAYDSCSLYPGPYMNMVVGPNGTGKSTIVAALALGLGWPPSVLGRSNEISEFIRYGSEFALIHVGLRLVRPLSHILDKIMEGKTTYDGTIKDITDREEYVKLKNREINIKNNVEVDEESFDADGVLLITRRIERSTTRGASNDWSVNGQRTNQRIVSSIMAQLNIQIDNLCQFLPQDKVSQFAAQTPAELLVETQKAGAPPFVHVLHSKLIELRKKEVDFLNKSTSAREEAISLRQVNEQVDAVRERMRAREEHQLIINRCQKKRPWLLYNEAIAESLSRKADLETNRRVLDTALADQKPLLEAVENAKDEVESLKSNIESENLKTKKKLPLNKHASADKTGYGIDANVQKLQGEIETERKSLHEIGNAIRGKRDLIFKQREAAVKKAEEIKKLRDDISALERDVKALNKKLPGVRKEQSSLTAEMQSLSDQMYDMERERERLESERLDISSQSDTLNAEINKLSAEERKLLDFKQQHIENVRRVSPDSIKAREWIQKNAFTFKGPVYGPICLEIEMKNPAAVRQIEAVIGRGTLLNFVVSSAEDNEIFRQNIMEGPDRLRVNVICVESTDQILQNIEKKYDWASMGFLGTAMDLIDGPRPVLAALAEISRIHQIPVATRENIDDEAIQRLQHPPIARYATSEAIVSISRSPYTTDILAKFVPLRPAVIIASNTVSAVDSSRLESIAKALSATRGRLAANKTRINIIIQDIRNRDEPLRRQRSEKDHLVQKIRDLVLEQKRWDDIQSTLTMRRERLNLLISNELDLSSSSPNQLQNNELNNALEEITTLIKERSRLAIGLTKLIENSFNAAMDRASTELLLSAKESRLAEAERALETAMEGTRTFQEQVEAAQELFERAKRNAKDLLARAKTCCGGRILTEEELADLSSLPDNLEELMRVERHAQVQYDVHGDASLSKRAIDEYMERASRADRLDEEAANSSTMLEKVTAQIDALSQDWVANVTLLVESISELFGTLFQRLGCAGEVQLVSAGRDYADYAISILVRFRELENLKPLSAQHHSGGEKSVATILYLLALQQDFTSLRANLKSTSLKSITNETCEREEADTDENIKDHESPNLDWQSNLIPPFRLVDEINQGMDAINERRVHDLMVEVATRTDNLNGENQASRSQYFLITPKLLPGLNYHPKMHILCVYSGEGVPEPRSLPIR